MTAEAEVVAESNVNFRFASDVWDIVQIALGILLIEVDGRWDDVVFHRHQTGGDFHPTGCAKKVSGHGFGGADDEAVFGVITEGALDSFGFANIAEASGGAMGVDVADFVCVDFSVLESHGHAACGTFALGMR